jgi:hypothetical protein
LSAKEKERKYKIESREKNWERGKEREQVEQPMAVGFPTGFSSYGIRGGQGERQSVDES